MTASQWRAFLILSVEDDVAGDERGLTAIAEYLAEADDAKQLLRDKGFGKKDTGLLDTARRVPRLAL